jgi:membrane protein
MTDASWPATAVPRWLRPAVVWFARRWVTRMLARAAAALVRVQIFDRSMTLAAQAFTSIFPILILLGALLGARHRAQLAEIAHLPTTSRHLIQEALGQTGLSAFGVLGTVVVLVSSTGLARALTRAYASVWAPNSPPTRPRSSWRWMLAVGVLAGYIVGSRLLGGLTDRLPVPVLASAVTLLLIDCALAILLPRILLAGTPPVRMLVAGGVAYALAMAVVRPVGSVYLPRALQTSDERYGTIGLAFTYISWLYVLSFCLLVTAVIGRVVAEDEGVLGRTIRGFRARPDRTAAGTRSADPDVRPRDADLGRTPG